MTDFGKTQKVVIVEDNTALNDIYKTRLELLGYQVFSAYDGLQALQVIERELPDLVLLDLMVPKKAGDQVLEEMRQSDWGKHIKVAIISNLNETDAPIGLRNLGIEAYAVKANLSNDQLDQLVDTILKPAGQAEDVLLSGTNHEVVSETPHDSEAIPRPDTAHEVTPETESASFVRDETDRPADDLESGEAHEEVLTTEEGRMSDAADASDEDTSANERESAVEDDPIASVWPTDSGTTEAMAPTDDDPTSLPQGSDPADTAL